MFVNVAEALLNIIKLAEDDVKAKRVRKAKIIFSELKEKLTR